MTDFRNYVHPYSVKKAFSKKAAYFCSEFAIDQSLKIYSGGLGYLAGSHMRSAYQLKQAMVGIGILWKYGYYDQERDDQGYMVPKFTEKKYDFLEDTGIQFEITINNHPVKVKALYLPPKKFGSAPLFLLTTDIPENDFLAQSISHRLYDSNLDTKIAQYQLLGIGGAKLLEEIGFKAEVCHLNEAHGLPAAFYEMSKGKTLEEVRDKFVFTTHTPVAAGNEKHNIFTLERMGFFSGVSLEEVRKISGIHNEIFDQTLVSLRVSRRANGVSRLHGEVARSMWNPYPGIADIGHITNSQNKKYWADKDLQACLIKENVKCLKQRKRKLKEVLFAEVERQTGKKFSPDVLTIVWARRFAGYKRADLLLQDYDRFTTMLSRPERPVQVIWAGKPYPLDHSAISTFNNIIYKSRGIENAAVVTGYELALSKLLKQGSDIWFNTPRVPREASGTSGMTAAMNASVNVSTNDGWIPEFAKHEHNAFVVPVANPRWSEEEVDNFDRDNFFRILDEEIIPIYYEQPEKWWEIVVNSMTEVVPYFDSDRMATQYYDMLYASRKKKAAKLAV
ncbi:MAG: alpha-glucan family phosphorylase [Saprospiraceae bacterium]|nr:alpha-glucan family phosphorylase [Saprospiraceae bacterium]